MTNFDLLQTVQPDDGYFAVVGIKEGSWTKQELVATREEVDALAEEYMAEERNVFFGVAKYTTDENRTKDNVAGLKSFWLDIDCGEAKAEVNPKTGRPDGYIDQEAGVEALKAFLATTGLPKPILVNSGRGIHAYWTFKTPVAPAVWQPAADRLKTLCEESFLQADPACTADKARILRLPDTRNFKNPDAPLDVALLYTSEQLAHVSA